MRWSDRLKHFSLLLTLLNLFLSPHFDLTSLGIVLENFWLVFDTIVVKSLRVSIVRLLLCGCRTVTVLIVKSCRVTIVGPLLCSYRTITVLTNPAGSLLWGWCCVGASHKLQSPSHKFVITLWVDLLCFTFLSSHWTLSSPISHKPEVTLEVDLVVWSLCCMLSRTLW